MMQTQKAAENIVIGLIDGLTVPFAIAAGLTAVLKTSPVIFTACIVAATAFSMTMGMSAYLSGKKYEPSVHNFSSALVICFSYIAGGFVAACPFLYFTDPFKALIASAIITVSFLLVAGYFDSKFNQANSMLGAFRTAFIGLTAAAAAFGVAALFR